MSDEDFIVDGTLLEAWASQKSFKPKGSDRTPPADPKNPTVNFHGQTFTFRAAAYTVTNTFKNATRAAVFCDQGIMRFT